MTLQLLGVDVFCLNCNGLIDVVNLGMASSRGSSVSSGSSGSSLISSSSGHSSSGSFSSSSISSS